MKSTALRLAVAAATIVSMGAPAAFAAANQSVTVNPFANFTSNVFKNVTSANTNTIFKTALGGPANQGTTNTSTALSTATTNVFGSAGNSVTVNLVGF